ncbi:MAG: hypothetical protein FWF59_06470, partial [Turicibacter sp.]|nr:hypothetical protein [Turicibacter sp.]
MKTIKYLALLGFAGDLLLNSLGVAALVANTQAAGGLYEMEDGPVAYAYETDGYEEAAEYEVEAEGTDEFYGYEAYGEIYYDEEFVEYGPDDIETEEVGGYGEYDSKGYGDEEVEETEYSEDEEVEETEYSEDEEEEFQLVFISREIAEQMSDEEIRELGGDVMETEVETVRPSGRSMVAESATPWRNLPPYNSCPNYNAQGNKIVDGVVVDGVQCVSSGAALNAAWNNNDVHRIIMVDNITLTASTLTTRRTSLEFDGNGRRPDGRPSGMGPNGDGFTLTRPATEATLNLGISMGTTSEETTVATPDDIGYFENGGGSLLHFHSVVIAGQQSSGGGSNTAFNGLINSNIPFENVGTATTPQRRNRTGTWRFRFGNIRMTNLDVTHDVQTGRVTDWAVRPGTDNSLHRFMRAPQSEITFYGDVLLNTRRQNFYAGKILFEDDTLYVGHISYAPSNFYGVFWFNMRMHARTTGSDPSCGRPGYLTLPVERPTAGTGENQTDCRNSVVLGRGARTYFTSGSTATHAPTVFGHWRNIIIGDNASFETSQNAPAIAFENNIANTGGAPSLAGVETINGATQTVRVHHGGRLVASRNNNGQVISNSSPNHNTSSTGSAEASNALIDIRSGATLKVVGSANTTGAGNTGAIINLTGTNNRLQVAKGANVDLRNESDLNTAHIFNRGSGANYIFETPSEIILWTNGADTGGTAQANSRNATYSFSGVGDLRVVGTATEFGSLAEGFQPNLPTLGNPDRFRRLITTPQGTAIQSLEPVNSSDTEIRGTVAWPSIPVSLGTGNGIIGRQREMRSLQSDRHDVLLNDSFNPEWVYTEADDEGNVEQVAGDPVWVRINPDGSFIYSDPYGRNQLQGSYILARMHLRDEGMTTRVLAFEAEDEEARQNLGCLYQDDEDGCYYTYYEDGRHELGFITAERMRMMTDEEIIAEGGGIISNGQPVARLGRLFPAWAEESPHNSCPNINGSGNFVVNLAVLQDANDPASGVICVGNDGIFTYAPGASQTVRNNVATANNNRATGHMQAAWSNNNIRRIIMMSDITLQSGTTGSSTSTVGGNPATVTFPANSHGSATLRNTSLEFDGNGTRPDGRPSGLGAGGDGFVLSQGSGQHSFNLAPYIGSGSTATYVANPTDSVDFANGAGGRVHFHSVVIHGTATMSYGANGPHRGVINSSLGWDGAYDGGSAAVPNRINRTGTWRFRFGNIRTNGFENIERDPITGRITDWDVQTTPANLPSIARLTRGQQAEMTFYGDVLLNTRAENVYTGKMLLEDGALYVGNVNRSTFSIVWFSARMHGQTTAADPSCGNLTLPAERPVAGAGENQTDCRNSLVLGSGARMYLTSTSTGSSYPAVYAHWRNIIVGEDAGFEVSTNNPSIAFSSGISNTGGMASMRGVTQTIRGHLGSRIIATRRSNGVVIHNQTSNINSAGG